MSALFVKSFFAVLISFLISFYCIPMLCRLAIRFGVVDTPDGKIKQHEKATPYLGGVAVYLGFISGLALVFPIGGTFSFLLIGTTLLLFVGLVDDLVVMRPYQKFFGQALAALCFLKGGLFLKEQFFYDFWFIGLPLSFLWIMTVINAFNLIDVMDGLATVTAFCATSSFLGIALWCHDDAVSLLLASFLGALAAFFWYNKPPATIYLGDAGSLFIGGFLATVPFLFHWSSFSPIGYFVPPILLAIPLLEVVTLVVVRTYKGIPFYHASPDHFSIYLRRRGWSKWNVLCYVVAISVALLGIALLVLQGGLSFLPLLAVGISFLFVWYLILFL